MLREAHRVHGHHSQREDLSVSCRRRRCPTERGDLLGAERGDLLSKLARKHRLGLRSTNKKSKILAECQAEINRHEFQAVYDRRSLLKLGEIVESQQEELHCARAEEVQQRDQQLLQEQLLQTNLELRQAHQKCLTEMEELKKFQSSTFDTIARRRLVDDQDTILELSGRIQELQNEINCISDSKEFQVAEPIRSGNSHVAYRPVSFPPHPILEGMLGRSFGVPSRKEGSPIICKIWIIFVKLIRIEAISRLNIRHKCEEKIGRRSRYYPSTHWQDIGIAE